MTSLLLAAELGDFALRTLERPGPNEWLALVVPPEEADHTSERLAEELSALNGDPVSRERFPSASALIKFIPAHRHGTLVLSGFDALDAAGWQTLDRDRSLLQRDGATVLVMGEEALGRLMGQAPNLASWLGGSVWQLERRDHSLSREDREERLTALRQWSGLTDEEVIALAGQGRLPGDPPFSEWLVLLGRGDLLGK